MSDSETPKMSTATKAAAIAVAGMLIGIITTVVTCIQVQNPDPAPSPSPSVSASASPSPSPAPSASVTPIPSPSVSPSASPSAAPSPSPSPSASAAPSPSPSPSPTTPAPGTLAFSVLKGGFQTFRIDQPSGSQLTAGVKVYEIRTVNTLSPSFKGARVGAWEDPLVPVTAIDSTKSYIVKFSPTASGTYTILGRQVQITMLAATYKHPAPFYMELQFDQVRKAHGFADSGTDLPKTALVNALYRSVYREYAVEPIKQYAAVPTTNLDNLSTFGASFRQTVLTGNIYPPCLMGPNNATAPGSDLVNVLQTAAPDGWFYTFDEGEGTQDALALSITKTVKLAGGRTYITRQWKTEFDAYVDLFIPVINWFDQPGRIAKASYGGKYGLYTSCMANGNCANQTDPTKVSPRTVFPGMVIEDTDGPAQFVKYSLDQGAKILLYFNGTQKLPTAWADGGQYNEGGNGDGTLVYKCPDKDEACPSLRLVKIGQAYQDYAKKLAGF